MEYRKFGSTIVVRHDPGENIIENVVKLAEKEHITLAEVNAIGAVNDLTIGVYDVTAKQYISNTFFGDYEITSLRGNITTSDGKPYLHLHMSAGDRKGNVVGGHLSRAIVSATCEMFIRIIDGSVSRVRDNSTGINILKFAP